MTIEIERRFLLGHVPIERLDGPGRRLRQGYLAIDGDVTVRVRMVEETATLTVKAGHGLARTEVETAIASADGEALWVHTVGRRVDKVRHRLPLAEGRLTAEIDVYDGDLAGLAVVEVEFPSVTAASAFEPPEWFGREVTGDARWGNASLASLGKPDELGNSA